MLKEIYWILLFFFVLLAVLYSLQRTLIYFPNKNKPERSTYHADDLSAVTLTTDDGLSLLSWYKAAQQDKPTIVYFHGNAGHIGNRMPIARQFLEQGLGILLVEYRGYGGNPGYPTEKGFYKDAEAAIHFLLNKNIKSKQLILYGESIGSAVAIYIGQHYPVCALILQSPMTSLTDLARYHYPWLPPIVWDKFNSVKRIDKLSDPLLFLHGTADQIVPFRQAKRLFKQANGPKQFISFDDKGHNNLWDEAYYQQIIQFIKANCY